MHTTKLLTVATSLSLLISCSVIPPEAYFERGTPESLMDQSSEVVSFAVGGDNSTNDMVAWINQDQPSRAELYCNEGDPACAEARQALQQFNVPVNFVPSSDNVATLVYERVVARDCESRYIDNSINPYNLSHPTLGCSIASNQIQMITDKRQITNPSLLEHHDGERLERMMNGYKEPYGDTSVRVDPNLNSNSVASFNLQGG